jgi:hypothetical protein
LGYKNSDINVVLSNSFVRNDSSWFNNVAQSPSFFARRVLNSDKDVGCANVNCSYESNRTLNLSKYGVYSPLYSSFDALYFFTPKHAPMSTTLRNDAPQGQTQSYNTAPYAKNSWSAATLTRKELALLEELSDLNLQMALPSGFATSNRQGFHEVLTANWKGLAEVKGLFASFEQISPNTDAKAAKYTEFGGGAMVNILGIIGCEYCKQSPLELSGSYKSSAKEQNWKDFGNAEFTSDFINAGLYYRFYRRFGLTFGFQRISSDLNVAEAEVQKEQTSNLNVSIAPIVKSAQNQLMAGLDYTVAKNAWLSINYGIISVKNTYSLDGFLDDNGRIARNTNMPGYVVVNDIEAGTKELKHEFSQNVLEATINVEF